MANRYMNGFDDVDITGLGYEMTLGGSPTIQTGRTGSCLQFTTSSTHYAYITVTPEGVATLTVGFAYKASGAMGATAFFATGDATRTHLQLMQNADGTISIRISGVGALSLNTAGGTTLCTSTAVVTLGSWMPLEFKFTIANSGGSAALRFNGSGVDDVSAVFTGDTQSAGTAFVTWIMFGGQASQTTWIDDLWVNDASGSVCNGNMGDRRVDFHLPDANGANSDWTRSTGANQYATIDENPPNTTDYNSSATLNQKDTVSVEAFKNGGASIDAIQISLLMQKSDSGSCALQTVIRESGADTDDGVSIYPGTSWSTGRHNYSLAGGDAKIAASGFDSAEYGYKKVA